MMENRKSEIHLKDAELESCFWNAAEQTGIVISKEYLGSMIGWPVRFVFETLWNKLMPYAKEKEIRQRVEESYNVFKSSIEKITKSNIPLVFKLS